jgi:hypothetical protein
LTEFGGYKNAVSEGSANMKKYMILMSLVPVMMFGFAAYSAGFDTITTTKVKITAGNHVLTGTFDDNATARALLEKFPLTIPMVDLYSREMCYHFPEALPAANVRTTGYEVGEIVYWPPRHSIVILYVQNGERFAMQKIGRIDSGVEVFRKMGDVDVTFELMDK